eukprot:5099443-Karenia_brevis.AAC.1
MAEDVQESRTHGNATSTNLLNENCNRQESANAVMLEALMTHSALIAWSANAMKVWNVQYNSHFLCVFMALRAVGD